MTKNELLIKHNKLYSELTSEMNDKMVDKLNQLIEIEKELTQFN